MGIDTILFTFDRTKFLLLDGRLKEFQQSLDTSQLGNIALQLADSERKDFLDALGKIELDPSARPTLEDRQSDLTEIGSRLFFGLCSPQSFNFTGSPLCANLYAKSGKLMNIFAAGGLRGREMANYLGEGSILLDPEICREMFGEVLKYRSEPFWFSYPSESHEFDVFYTMADKTSFDNVAVAYL